VAATLGLAFQEMTKKQVFKNPSPSLSLPDQPKAPSPPSKKKPTDNCEQVKNPFVTSSKKGKPHDNALYMAQEEGELGFDREVFRRRVRVVAVIVAPREVDGLLKVLRGVVLAVPKIRPVQDAGDGTPRKAVLLAEQYPTLESLPETQRTALSAKRDAGAAEIGTREVELDWTTVSTVEMLRRLVPVAGELPSAFETVGHIAHLNLREELRTYGRTIGAVILAKNPAIRTVVNKVGTIETEFRTFPMEVLAGDPVLDAEVHESGCRFRFNFAEVYWNSRLGTEHVRLVSEFASTDVVCDMFAGVGPFAVPAAKNRKCVVHANDLNPRSYHFLVENARLNRVESRVLARNVDGRDFVRALAREGVAFTRVIMNLPGEAVEFLDVFGELVRAGWAGRPLIHCYSFSRNIEDPLGDLLARARAAAGPGVVVSSRSIHDVRDVAPNKRMYCITLLVDAPADASEAAPSASAKAEDAEPTAKKQKTE
jgi:tRNA (guanine37-N1)-methyltransferase